MPKGSGSINKISFPKIILLLIIVAAAVAILSNSKDAYAGTVIDLNGQSSCETIGGTWNSGSNTCTVTNISLTLTNVDSFIVDSGITLVINGGTIYNNGGTITINTGSSLTINAANFINSGTISATGGSIRFIAAPNISNTRSGTINIKDTSFTITQTSTLTNSGTMTIGSGSSLTVDSSSLSNFGIINNSGTTNNNSGGIFDNFDTINNFYTFSNSATFNNHSGANLNEYRMFSFPVFKNNPDGTINNAGTITNSAGTITNDGTLNNRGTLNNGLTAIIINNDVMVNYYILRNDGTLNNDHILTNYLTATIVDNSIINNGPFGIITDSGFLHINPGGSFVLGHGSSFTVDATGRLANDGSMICSGTMTVAGGILENGNTVTITSNGAIINDHGTIHILSNGNFVNSGTIENTGMVTIDLGGSFDNIGTVNINTGGAATNGGTLTNRLGAIISNAGSITNIANALLRNFGTVTSTGIVNNNGNILNICGGVFNGPINGNQPINQCVPLSLTGGFIVSCENPSVGDSCSLGFSPLFKYSWILASIPAGSVAVLDNPSSPSPSFTPDMPGCYQLSVVVTDALGNAASDSRSVSVQTTNCGINPPPLPSGSINPCNNPTVGEACPARFALSSVTYQWSIMGTPPGSHATLVSMSSPSTSITPDLPGQYVVQLAVTDHGGITSIFSKTITAIAAGCNGNGNGNGNDKCALDIIIRNGDSEKDKEKDKDKDKNK